MPKQRFEKYISKELSQITEGIWFQKNQVQPFAFHQSVGDFIILTPEFNFVLECKECKNLDGKGIFNLSRLTQLNDLKLFESRLSRNISLIGILFWGGTLKKSSVYIIPISVYNNIAVSWKKSSFNVQDMMKLFPFYEIKNLKELQGILLKLGEGEYANKNWVQK